MISKILNWYRDRKRFKYTYRELNRLTDRELDDMGIHRSMITRVALESTYGQEKL
jgi:uncharacterized protein YjiS (DUF1127 family)